jgi:hypothetical protein
MIMEKIHFEPEIMTVLFESKDRIIFGKQDGTCYIIDKLQEPIHAEPNARNFIHEQEPSEFEGKWPELLHEPEKINLTEFRVNKEGKRIAIGYLAFTHRWVVSDLED